MWNFGQIFLMAYILPLVVTGVTTWVTLKVYKRGGLDKPHRGKRQKFKDTHQGLVPRGGGVAIFSGLGVTLGLSLFWFGPMRLLTNWVSAQPLATVIDPQIVAIYLGALGLTVTGLLDDVFDLSPLLRLVINILLALLLVGTGLTINFVTNPLGEGVIDLTQISWLPGLLTVFYVVALTNVTNWAKGVDGQLPGMVVIAALIIGGVSLKLTGDFNYVWWLSSLVAGSFAGFLCWNFYPQKIMPGFGGGALAGFLLAVLSMMAGAKIATLFMVLALPIADAAFTVARRVIAGKSPFLGDRGHLHHKLLDRLGWGRRRIAIFYWLVTLVMGILALVLSTWGKIIAFLLVSLLVFYFLIVVKLRDLKV